MKNFPCVALITRPQPKADELAALIDQEGGKTIVFPTFSIEEPMNIAALKQQIQALTNIDIAVFVSPHAVKKTMPYFSKLRKNSLIAAVGKSTKEILERHGFTEVTYPKANFSSESLLALPELQTVHNKTVIIFQGETSRGLLQNVLTDRGAKVVTAIAYRRVLCTPVHSRTILSWKNKSLNCVIYTSAEGLLNLFKLINLEHHPWLKSIPSLVISPRLKKIAKQIGIQHVFESENARANAIIEALKKAYQKRKIDDA